MNVISNVEIYVPVGTQLIVQFYFLEKAVDYL